MSKKAETDDIPERWAIGVERRDVAFYVVLALVAGFVIGLITARTIDSKEKDKEASLNLAQTTAGSRDQQSAESTGTSPQPADFHRVSRILRGDTVEVQGIGPVRMIGIDTPDGKPPREIYGAHGQRAVGFVEQSLLNQDVRIEYDPAFAGRDNRNETGQTLAYIYTRDGTLVNAEMLKQGLAFVRSDEQFKLGDDFRSFEREAMRSMRGVWGTSTSAATTSLDPLAQSPTENTSKPKLSPLAPSAIGPNLPAISTSTPAASSEPSVFISADKLYHRNSACELMDSKKQTLPISQAKSRGYTPCSRCYPSNTLKVN